MNHIRVHYSPETGLIHSWDNAHGGDPLFGSKIVVFEIPEGHEIKIDPTAQRIDLATLEIEDMADHEIAAARAPQVWEITQAIMFELAATDAMMAPDRKVDNRDLWIAYRQELRDVSKNNASASDMVIHFPLRPDGVDIVAALRARIKG
jgi:hypothetical protein